MPKRRTIKTIGIAFNLKRDSRSDTQEEYDTLETIHAIRGELLRQGFKVVLLEQNGRFLRALLKADPDFVFNMSEGIGKSRSRESQVPCILESLGIPYSGSDPIALGIALDKYLTSRLLDSADIPVPLMYLVGSEREISALPDIFARSSSFVVKPRWEGSSKGVTHDSVVRDRASLRGKCRDIFSRYRQPAVIEAFLEREEITVGVYGNHPAVRLLGMMEIAPQNASDTLFLYSLENKRNWRTTVRYLPQDSLSPALRSSIQEYACKAFQALELRDIARIDFRVDKHGTPRIIDVNPLPGLSPVYSDLPILCNLNGKTYQTLIQSIVASAFKRYGFSMPKGNG